MNRRNSQKRESILACFRNTDRHPSAEWVYEQLKPQYPDLSLGTVYRNIGQLIDEGRLRTVGVVGDRERFDGRTDPHCHAVCTRCGKVIDLDGVTLLPELCREAQQTTDFWLREPQVRFDGLCRECREKEVK